jgi:SAM-dependent methyltransferase
MNEARREHWESVYTTKPEDQTSWFRPHLDESLRLIDGLDLPSGTPVIDVGGGRATLVDDLLSRGFIDVTVLDTSKAALDEVGHRLGAAGEFVHWMVADITRAELLPTHYGLWHDRAVFHFLTEPVDRMRYVTNAARSIQPGGHAIVATFATDGPERCSGLPVRRYDAAALVSEFEPAFERIADSRERHPTPFGSEQPFTYVLLRRRRR